MSLAVPSPRHRDSTVARILEAGQYVCKGHRPSVACYGCAALPFVSFAFEHDQSMPVIPLVPKTSVSLTLLFPLHVRVRMRVSSSLVFLSRMNTPQATRYYAYSEARASNIHVDLFSSPLFTIGIVYQ
jgi:hypothetical protein